MKIKQRVQDFSFTKDYWKKRREEIQAKIKTDTTGAFWHIDETIKRMNETCLSAEEIQEKMNLSFTPATGIKQSLQGVSVGVKDLFCVKGMTTTAGSKILDKFVAPYDSTVWKSLSDRGAFLAGKLSMDEFAMGSFTNTSYLGKTSVPGYPEHSAGGSSGGSAAAVASGIVDISIGSDTGGSVRLPASFCGVVGYKPSYGAFSRFGMIPYASSLDQAGFFTKTIEDLHYVITSTDVDGSPLASKDPKDMTCVGLGDYEQSHKSIKKVGYFEDILTNEAVQLVVREAYQKTLDILSSNGVELVPVKIDFMDKAAQIYYIIACSEASSNLARYQGVYFGEKLSEEPMLDSFAETISSYRSKYLGDEVQRRIMLGSFILSAENFVEMYEKSWAMRKSLTKSIEDTLQIVDTLVLPVSPTVSPKWSEIENMTPAQIYYSDYMTVPFSLAGVPAISMPLHKTEEGLHIGMQFVGSKFKDYELIDKLLHLEKIIGEGK